MQPSPEFNPRRPRGTLAAAAFAMSAVAMSVLVLLPMAVASQVPELRTPGVAFACAQ